MEEIGTNTTDITNRAKRTGRKRILAVVIAAAFFLAVIMPLVKIGMDVRGMVGRLPVAKQAMKAQDIKKIQEAIAGLRKDMVVLQDDLRFLGWTRYIPLFGSYSRDVFAFVEAGGYGLEAGEIMARAAVPYVDTAAATAEERIAKIVATLDKVTPQMEAVAEKTHKARLALERVNSNRYPQNLFGQKVREQVALGKEIVVLADEVLIAAAPMVNKLPEMLGMKGEKKYLVLFQNNTELRPTGGFITAYAVFRMEKGKIYYETADDIYRLDDTLRRSVAPPEPIAKYLNVYTWRLRDANFSPDFASSMRTFLDLYASAAGPKNITGVVAVDIHALVKLMDVLGPISVYGQTFTTKEVPECGCPMIVYELLKAAGTPRGYWVDNRKDMIGVLLQILIKKAMDAPSELNGPIFQTLLAEAKQKHLLFYFPENTVQAGVEALNFAGRVKTAGGDYLHINDANLAGAKSNLYIVPTVKQEVTVTDFGAETTLTLEYKYPRQADNCSLERKEGLCLAGIYRDYLRVYLPKGAVIVETRGFESKNKTFEDLDHTVVDGYFTVVPQGLGKVQIKYRVPGEFKKIKEYRSLIQKQPGTNANHYSVIVNGKTTEFSLSEDKELVVKL